VILLVSENSVASKWVSEEWKTFLNPQKKIVPVLLRECKVPQAIRKLEMTKTPGSRLISVPPKGGSRSQLRG
jgi:hypothetical protein